MEKFIAEISEKDKLEQAEKDSKIVEVIADKEKSSPEWRDLLTGKRREIIIAATALIPVLSPGCGVLDVNYSSPENIQDWKKVENYLRSRIPIEVVQKNAFTVKGHENSPKYTIDDVYEELSHMCGQKNTVLGENYPLTVNREVFKRGFLKVYVKPVVEGFSTKTQQVATSERGIEAAMIEAVHDFEQYTDIPAKLVDSPEEGDVALECINEKDSRRRPAYIGHADVVLSWDSKENSVTHTAREVFVYTSKGTSSWSIPGLTINNPVVQDQVDKIIGDKYLFEQSKATGIHELTHGIGFYGHSPSKDSFMNPVGFRGMNVRLALGSDTPDLEINGVKLVVELAAEKDSATKAAIRVVRELIQSGKYIDT